MRRLSAKTASPASGSQLTTSDATLRMHIIHLSLGQELSGCLKECSFCDTRWWPSSTPIPLRRIELIL